jgi:hypothetical protein
MILSSSYQILKVNPEELISVFLYLRFSEVTTWWININSGKHQEDWTSPHAKKYRNSLNREFYNFVIFC